MGTDQPCSLFQRGRIIGAQLDLDILPDRRPHLEGTDFDNDAGNADHGGADFPLDQAAIGTLAEGFKLDENARNAVGRSRPGAVKRVIARRLAGDGVIALDAFNPGQPALGLQGNDILLGG